MTSSYLTHRTFLRDPRVPVTVTLRKSDGSVHSVCNPAEYDLTGFMTIDQRRELAIQCKEEMEND